MLDEPESRLEELIRDAGDCASLPADLRERVIAGAQQAATTRLWCRRIAGVASVLLCMSLLGVGSLWGTSSATAPNAPPTASYGDVQAEPKPFSAPSDFVAMSSIGAWGHVECVVRLRTVHGRILRGVY